MSKPNYLDFALSYGVPTNAFYTLPAVFEHAAAIGGITADAVMKRCRTNHELAHYLVSVAVRAAAADARREAGAPIEIYEVY